MEITPSANVSVAGVRVGDGDGGEASGAPNPGGLELPVQEATDDDWPFPDLVVEVTLSPMTARPGDQVRLSGTCTLSGDPGDYVGVGINWADNDDVVGLENSFSLAVSEIRSDGSFDHTFTIAKDAVAGVYEAGYPQCGLEDQSWFATEPLGSFIVLPAENAGGNDDDEGGENSDTSAPGSEDVFTVARLAETGSGELPVALLGAIATGVFGLCILVAVQRKQSLSGR
ncbi:hypothetical protein [Leucobacter sp. 7(1)]|uniref:hypothetical protein n=1 Tax=Leucobacter sp. 7(1) TaxID=1255613 RepID=UPI001121EB69|nr:hypothetical protein [Leucobacter sp. 7(1)]